MDIQKDLAKKEHWDSIYSQSGRGIWEGWKPRFYGELSIENMLLKEIDRFRPETVLEIGCGSSLWLSYLAKKRKIKIFGLDYSEAGCELARKRLEEDGVNGLIFCDDFLKADPQKIGQFDFVYSLGVAEHFSNLEDVLFHMLKFVKPGGVLLTQVPNLVSIHGILVWLYQPRQLEKHQMVTKSKLENAYRRLSLTKIESSYLGLISLGILAWGYNQRFPGMDKTILPTIKKLVTIFDKMISKLNVYKGIPFIAPFLYITGIKNK